MSKRIMTTLGVVTFLIAMAGTQASAQSVTIHGKQNFLSHLTVVDSCTGEKIPLNINTLVSYAISDTFVNNSVVSSVQAHVDVTGSGTGTPSGSLYTLRSVEDVATDVPTNPNNIELSTAGDALLVSHGSAPNLPIHLTVHINIVNADILIVTVDATTSCGG